MITVSSGDGLVTADRLRDLLALGVEYDDLDFKVEWDPKGIHLNKFVKTMAAMSSMEKGGYVIVGVDDNGNRVGIDSKSITDKRFDPANLGKIYKDFTGNSGIRSATHCIDEKYFAIIYIPRSPELFSVMEKDAHQNGGGDKFKSGDVFVRENTSNMKLSKISASRIVEKIRHEEREANIKSFFGNSPDLNDHKKAISVINFISVDSEDQLNLLKDRNDYEEIALLGESIINLIFESNDDLDNNKIRNSLSTVLGYLLLHDEDSFESLVLSLSQRYVRELGNSENLDYRKSRIAFEIISVVEAVGALAVRRKRFDLAGILANVQVYVGSYKYSSWLRHGQVMAARARVTNSVTEGMPVGSVLINKAFEEITIVQGLRPECQSTLEYEMMKESLLDSVVSFDFLWCMIAFEASNDESDYYPSWIFFAPDRIVNFVEDITSDFSKRKSTFIDPSINNLGNLFSDLLLHPERYVDQSDLTAYRYRPDKPMDAFQKAAENRKARELL